MRRRLYVDPESGTLEDCSEDPSYGWDSPACVVLRDNEDLWQRYLAAERAWHEARAAVVAVAAKEPMTEAEQDLSARSAELCLTEDLVFAEFLRRRDEIAVAARALAERDGLPVDEEGAAS